MNKKRAWLVSAIALSFIIVFIVWWPYLRIPGAVTLHRSDGSKGIRAIYLFRPGRILGRWSRITPLDVFAFDFAWSPDGQHLIFECADGWDKWTYVHRPGIPEIQKEERPVSIRKGFCLVERNGSNFRWLKEIKDENIDCHFGRVQWTLDGEYVVVNLHTKSPHQINIHTGNIEPWTEDTQDLVVEETRLVSIPEEEAQRYGKYAKSLLERTGTMSLDGRFAAFINWTGESDPAFLFIYDTHTEKLLRFMRANNHPVYISDISWRPKP